MLKIIVLHPVVVLLSIPDDDLMFFSRVVFYIHFFVLFKLGIAHI